MLRLAASLAVLVLSAGVAWAQVAEGTAAAVHAADKITDTGPIGAVFVFAALVLLGGIGLLWMKLAARDATIMALQDKLGEVRDKRADENADWAGKFATTATTAAAEIRNATAKLEGQERVLQAIAEIAKAWPPAIASILASLDTNRTGIAGIPDALRAIIREQRGH